MTAAANPLVFGDPRIPARIWRLLVVDTVTGCWVWVGYRSSADYGRTWWQGRRQMVHRVLFAALVGPIPDGLQLDHRCHNRPCANPSHTEPVTPRENTLRGIGPSALNAKKTRCCHGHVLAGDNLHVRRDKRGRQCRACQRKNAARWHARRRAETDEPNTQTKIIGTNLGTHGVGTLTPGRRRTNGPQQPAA